LKPSRVADVLEKLLKSRWAVFLWGPPGVGKSSIVRAVATGQKLPLIDIRAALLDPTDLRGIPSVQNGRAVWCPPSFLPSDPESVGILFFDELSAAPPLVQASLYQLTLDRRVGEYVLPAGWRIVAAGNRAEDASISFRMPAALSNRFVHLDFEVDYEDWRAWAIGAGIHPLVLGFIGTRRELLFSMKNTDRGFPTPRSWEIVSDALGSMGGWKMAADFLDGIVGEGAAVEFVAYCQNAIQEEAIRAIIADPEGAELPTSLGDRYALISYLAATARERSVLTAVGKLVHRFPPELAVLLMRDVLRANPRFTLDPGYQRFVKEHQSLLV
jgi:hypothetical protein